MISASSAATSISEGEMMRKITGRLSLLAGLALAATSLSVPKAEAAPPTLLTNEWTEVYCTGLAAGIELTVRAGIADDGSGTISYSSAQLSTIQGETLGGGESDSTFDGSDFSATIPIYEQVPGDGSGGHRSEAEPADEPQEPGPLLGEVVFSGSFTDEGDPEVQPVKGQDGNIHFTQTNTLTTLSVHLDTLAFEDTVFTDVTCGGERGSGSLKYSNPHTVVRRENDTVAQCETNADEYDLWKEEDGWYVEVGYLVILEDGDEDPENNPQIRTMASGMVEFGRDGIWDGELTVHSDAMPGGEPPVEDPEPFPVSASATLEREGQPFHVPREDRKGMRDHAQFTPYHLTLRVDLTDPYPDSTSDSGVSGGTYLDCAVSTVQVTQRSVNHQGE